MRFSFPSVFAACSMTTLAIAQPGYEWRQITPANSPSSRCCHEMVYDAARQQTLLFGGFDGSYFADTWTFDGTNWTQLTPANSPPPRRNHAMAYDPFRQRVVLIGGENGPTTFDDTWEWDGVDWTQVASGTAGVRARGAACFDPRLGGIVYASQFDTKVWDGTSWNTLFLSNVPPYAIDNMQIVYHPVDGVIGLYSHYFMRFQPQIGWDVIYEEWEYFYRQFAATAIDPSTSRVMIHGGSGGLGGSTASAAHDTWIWEGDGFSLITANGPPGSADGQMVFDSNRGAFVLFGGSGYSSGSYRGETWELLEVNLPGTYETFGQACSGASSFLPALNVEPTLNSAPVVGGTFTVRGDGLPPNAVFGILGTSDQVWGTTSLPLDLSVIGMPGCNAYVNHITTTTLAGSAGTRFWTMTIPSTSTLAGFQFFQQLAAIAPGANALDLVWSNAGGGTIGLP